MVISNTWYMECKSSIGTLTENFCQFRQPIINLYLLYGHANLQSNWKTLYNAERKTNVEQEKIVHKGNKKTGVASIANNKRGQ